MSSPRLCLIFNNVDDTSGIGKLCAWSVRTALEADWQVTVVARDLDPELRSGVEWLPLYVPPRLHAVQWYAALPTVRHAMAGRRWDVVHVSQPQLVPVADVLQLHYIVRAAREHAPVRGPGLRPLAADAQSRLTQVGEDRALRRLPGDLTLMPVTSFLAAEFARLYGSHRRTTVLESPAPRALTPPTAVERDEARRRFVGDRPGAVVGFLGGDDPRKGGARLLDAATADGTVVLYGGAGVPDHPLARDGRRVVRAGYVRDVKQFLWACDVLAIPSTWDPMPTTALEAAAAGVPVMGTMTCGTVRDLVEHGAAVRWAPGEPLGRALTGIQKHRDDLLRNARSFLAGRNDVTQRQKLIEVYAAHLHGGAR